MIKVASKFNFSYPSYATFVRDVYGTATESWFDLETKYKTPTGWWNLMLKYGGVTQQDIYYTLMLTVFWTLLRIIITDFIYKPIVNNAGLDAQSTRKAPESVWKLLFYSCTWAYSIYILFFTEHNFFYDAPSSFYGWKPQSPVPTKIYIAYLVQFSFYAHSVYGTLFMDVWRKDSKVMLAHHFVTLLLIGFSYAFRYTNVGILILFLHDITDILLEGTKLAVYYKTKGGKWHSVCDFLSTVGFILFGVAWYIFRLYWFPLKAMYAAGHVSLAVSQDLVFYHFFNALLWILLAMNIYWFTFIVVMAYKVVTKQVSEVDDTRELDSKNLTKSVVQNGKKRD
ncbi:ceramide synthase 1-like [Clavelina lepadiformis]|uniref:ceramide synthase 1-like n=1 Tax=Clavelina lepadiformis TaxID=159417 RepID=UPI0040415367